MIEKTVLLPYYKTNFITVVLFLWQWDCISNKCVPHDLVNTCVQHRLPSKQSVLKDKLEESWHSGSERQVNWKTELKCSGLVNEREGGREGGKEKEKFT